MTNAEVGLPAASAVPDGVTRPSAPRFPLDPGQAHALAYAVAILRALHDASGNHEQAAEALGMSRRTMDDHIARLGMTELQSALWPRSVRQPKRR